MIHRVVKCVLYILGKKRKHLLRWTDVSKHLTADLLRALIDYDPTALKKKKKFVMIERELKKIARADVRKQGSRPAREMYGWLNVCLQLRREAVAARKRAKEVGAVEPNAEDLENDSDDPDAVDPGVEEEI